jgi:hypothetical protein
MGGVAGSAATAACKGWSRMLRPSQQQQQQQRTTCRPPCFALHSSSSLPARLAAGASDIRQLPINGRRGRLCSDGGVQGLVAHAEAVAAGAVHYHSAVLLHAKCSGRVLPSTTLDHLLQGPPARTL